MSEVDMEELLALEIVNHPIDSGTGIQNDTQVWDGATGGLSKISGTVTIGSQHNELHLQPLLSVRALHRRLESPERS